MSDATDAVTVDLGAGTSTGGSGTDTLTDIEDVRRRSGARRHLTGQRPRQLPRRVDGNDTLAGGAGDSDGDDTFDGGSGIDTVDYGDNTLATTVDLNDGRACSGSHDTLVHRATMAIGDVDSIRQPVENAILGPGNDTFTGRSFNNTVWPNGGQNSLNGCPALWPAADRHGELLRRVHGWRDGQPRWWWPVWWQRQDSILGSERGRYGVQRQHHRDRPVWNQRGELARRVARATTTSQANTARTSSVPAPGTTASAVVPATTRLEGSGWQGQHQRLWWCRRHLRRQGQGLLHGGGGNDFIKTCEKPQAQARHGPNGPGLHQRI